MNTMKISRFWLGLLIPGLLLIFAAPLQAAYEVSGVTFSQTVTADQFVRVTEDLTISWTAPTGSDPILNYYFKLNTSSTPLSDQELSDTTYDFTATSAQSFKTIAKSTFDAYDSDKLRYLHIKTQYLNTGTGNIAYSTDVVTGPIRIDNVAPTGTITLDPTSGSTNVIDVSMSPTESIKYYWLNDAATFPGGTGSVYADFPQGAVGLREGTAYGTVKIYAWFEDFAGNRTTAASASADYNYTAPVAIQYNSSTVAVDASLGFTVDGATTYIWTITDPSVDGVAVFEGGGTGPLSAASVTVVGKKAGTFTVTAKLSDTDPNPLKTGTITVAQSYTLGDVDGSGAINVFDVIKIARASLGLDNTGTFIAAAADIDKNGSINVFDVIKAARLSLGLSI